LRVEVILIPWLFLTTLLVVVLIQLWDARLFALYSVTTRQLRLNGLLERGTKAMQLFTGLVFKSSLIRQFRERANALGVRARRKKM